MTKKLRELLAQLEAKQNDVKAHMKTLDEAGEGFDTKAYDATLDDLQKDIEGICSCCKCCCGIFQLFYGGVMPFHTITSYIAKVKEDDCVGCGTCVEKCPMETIDLEDAIAIINENKCIGCGVCAHHCPEGAIYLERTGPRNVFIPPHRKEYKEIK